MECENFRYDEQSRLVGDPVDVVSGTNTYRIVDFTLPGPLPLEWRRYYSSAQNDRLRRLGWGHTHEFDRCLHLDADGLRYVGPDGAPIGFPPLLVDGEAFSQSGLVLRRQTARIYELTESGSPAMEFAFTDFRAAAPLRCLREGRARIECRYTAEGHLQEILDSRGRVIRVECDPQGRLVRLVRLAVSKQDKDRVLLAYQFDRAGNLAEGVDAYGHRFSCAYDEKCRLTRRTDRRGFSFHFAYDRQGRCVRTWGDGNLLDTRLRYLPEQQGTVVTRVDGGDWTYLYNETGTVTQIIDPLGGIQRFQTDAEGRVVEEVDPNNNVSQVLYDGAGVAYAKRSPLGKVKPLAADPGYWDPDVPHIPGHCLGWEWGDRLVAERIALPSPGSAAFWRVPLFARGLVRTAPPVPESEAVHDANDADGGEVRDEFGLLIRAVGPGGKSRRWSYAPNGMVSRYHDREGATYRVEYTSWNQPHRTIDPLGNEVTYEFSATDCLAKVVDGGGTRTEFTRDLKDRLTRVIRHGKVKEEYLYDAGDNMVEKRDGEGNCLLTQEIGPNNLLAARRLGSGETHRFAYDDKGRLARTEGEDSVCEFAYDEWGNRTQDERDGLGVRQEFEGLEPVATTVLGRFQTHYSRTSAGAFVLRDPTGREHRIEFLGHGLVIRSLANGSTEVSQYDAVGHCLVKVASPKKAVARPWSRVYQYSPEGDLVRVEDAWRGTSEFTYDAAHRLTGGRVPGGQALTFAYDAAGNLLRQPGLEQVSLLDGNRLASANDDVFEYNARNHIAAVRGPSGERCFHYNELDQLAERSDGNGRWQAHYDPLGRRTRKSWGNRWVEYYWYRDRLEAEVNQDGRVRIYVYADISAYAPMMFVDYQGLDAEPAAGQPHYIFSDQAGAPLLVEDAVGNMVWTASLEPYGRARIDPASRIDMPLRFPGHYWDAETGLHYNRFRYYNPELGRYLQSDPLGLAGGFNLYAYPANPLTRVDVQGLQPCTFCRPDARPDGIPPKESDSCYGPEQLGYFHNPFSIYSERPPNGSRPRGGWKLHISAHLADAQIVARSVLPKLREMDAWHKVTKSREAYRGQNEGDQQGKFITVYTRNAEEAQRIVNAVDPELKQLGDHGGIQPPPVTTNRPRGYTPEAHQRDAEIQRHQRRLGELEEQERQGRPLDPDQQQEAADHRRAINRLRPDEVPVGESGHIRAVHVDDYEERPPGRRADDDDDGW